MARTGAMRDGPFRLDMPDPTPGEARAVTWLRDMVEDRRRAGVPTYGQVMIGEERSFRSSLRSSLVDNDAHPSSAILV